MLRWSKDFENNRVIATMMRGDVEVRFIVRQDDATVTWEQGGGPELYGEIIKEPMPGCLVTDNGYFFMPVETAEDVYALFRQHTDPAIARKLAAETVVATMRHAQKFLTTWCFQSFTMQIWHKGVMLLETPKQTMPHLGSNAPLIACFLDYYTQAIENAKMYAKELPADLYAWAETLYVEPVTIDIKAPPEAYLPLLKEEWVPQGEMYEEEHGCMQIGVTYIYEHERGGFWKGYMYSNAGRWVTKGMIQANTYQEAIAILDSMWDEPELFEEVVYV